MKQSTVIFILLISACVWFAEARTRVGLKSWRSFARRRDEAHDQAHDLCQGARNLCQFLSDHRSFPKPPLPCSLIDIDKCADEFAPHISCFQTCVDGCKHYAEEAQLKKWFNCVKCDDCLPDFWRRQHQSRNFFSPRTARNVRRSNFHAKRP